MEDEHETRIWSNKCKVWWAKFCQQAGVPTTQPSRVVWTVHVGVVNEASMIYSHSCWHFQHRNAACHRARIITERGWRGCIAPLACTMSGFYPYGAPLWWRGNRLLTASPVSNDATVSSGKNHSCIIHIQFNSCCLEAEGKATLSLCDIDVSLNQEIHYIIEFTCTLWCRKQSRKLLCMSETQDHHTHMCLLNILVQI